MTKRLDLSRPELSLLTTSLRRKIRELAASTDHGTKPLRLSVLHRGKGPGTNGDIQGTKALNVLQILWSICFPDVDDFVG